MFFVLNAAGSSVKNIRHRPKKFEDHDPKNLILPSMILCGCAIIFLS